MLTDLDAAPPYNAALTPSTPPHQHAPHLASLSPPNSQGGVALPNTTMPSVAPSASGANVNGKRPLDSLDAQGDAMAAAAAGLGSDGLGAAPPAVGAGGEGGRPTKVHTHAESGYSWSKIEDAPGWSWQNRKALDEAQRAWETGVVGKDRTVKGQFVYLDWKAVEPCFVTDLTSRALRGSIRDG